MVNTWRFCKVVALERACIYHALSVHLTLRIPSLAVAESYSLVINQ